MVMMTRQPNNPIDVPIRALVISTNGLLSDGITAWMRTTFSAMNTSGFDLTTLAWEDSPKDVVNAVQEIGFDIATVPNRKYDLRGYASAFKAVLDKKHFDIIHVSCNSALATFELHEAKKRVVGMRIAHSHNTMCTHRVADYLLRPAFYHSLTDCYACGRDAGRWLFGDRPFTVIPNGKILQDWAFSSQLRDEARTELGILPDELAIGHVGGFNQQKNHKKLVRVFSKLHERSARYRLVLIGDGDLMGQIKELASNLGVAECVTFLGRRPDVPRLLNALDCMVLPSLYEGFPNVVLEWQLSGLPCVISSSVTDDVVITPLVTQIPLDSSDSVWADAVERAMAHHNRTTDSENARHAAKEQGYDIHDDAALLRRLYLEGVALCH